MTPQTEANKALSADTGTLPEASTAIPLTRIVVAVWVRRTRVLLCGALGLVAGGAVAFVLPNTYTSSASLMPPDASSLSQPSAINLMASVPLSLGGSLASQRTPGATLVGILSSRSEQDALIQRFNLAAVYRTRTSEATRKQLTENSLFDEDKKSGIVTIKVSATDRVLARDLAQAYVDEGNRQLNRLSTSAAGREHTFLESRIADVKRQLDQSSAELSRFSSAHETLNPAGQGAALIQAQALLKEQIGAAQSELAGLQAVYTGGNVRVQAARARLNTLSGQLAHMDAAGGGESTGQPGSPSLRQLPMLAVTYADLARQVQTQQAIFETLTKQMEVAKVQEAKDTPVAKELDAPVLADRKSSPQRSLLALGGGALGLVVGVLWLATAAWWRLLDLRYDLLRYLRQLSLRERELRSA